MGMPKLVVVGFVLWAAVGTAYAEPYMAVRDGFKCSGCHTNQTGGGKRTSIVVNHARDILHYPHWFDKLSAPADAFNGELHKYVAIGADLRASNTAVFQDQGASGRVKNNTAFRGRLEADVIDVREAVAYLEVRLIPDTLTFYLDQEFQTTTGTREAFGMLRLPWNVFLKAGRMFLPYGLQLQDDTAFIRGGHQELTSNSGKSTVNTGFSFNLQEPAFEIGYEPGPFSLIVAVSDGAPRDRDVRATGTVYTMLTDVPVVRNVMIGGSGSRVGPPGSETTLLGVFAGTNLGPFTYLGEADFRSDKDSTTGGKHQGIFIHYSEGDLLLFDWLNVKVAFDYADSSGDLTQRADDSENRISVGLEPFLSRFLQTRLVYRVSNGVKSQPTHNQDLLMAEAHVFF
jgi:hypothetical protein